MQRSPNSIPRNGLIFEALLDGNVLDTNDGTKNTLTATSLTYAECPFGYQKQYGVFNGSSSKVTFSGNLGFSGSTDWTSIAAFKHLANPANNSTTTISRINESSTKSAIVIEFYNNGGTIQINGGRAKIGVANAITQNWTPTIGGIYFVETNYKTSNGFCELRIKGTDGTDLYYSATLTGSGSVSSGDNTNIGTTSGSGGYYNGNIGLVRHFNRILTEQERISYWLEFNRQLAGGTDFGAVIPAPVLLMDCQDKVYEVANGFTANEVSITDASLDVWGLPRSATIGASGRIEFSGMPQVVTGSAFTSFCVFKTPSSFPAGNGRFLNIQNDADNASNVFWYWNGTGFRVTNYNGSSSAIINSSVSPQTNTWYCMAYVQNGTNGSFYVKPFGSAYTKNTGSANSITNGTTRMILGSYYGGGGDYIQSQNSRAGCFNSAFSDDQISALFARLESPLYPYPFRRSLSPALGVTAYYDGTFSGSTAYDIIGGWGNKSIGGTMPSSVRFLQNKSFAPTGSQYINLGAQNHYNPGGWWYGQWISTASSLEMRNEFNSSNGYFTMLRYNATSGKAGAFFYDGANKSVDSIKTINDGRPHFCVAEFLPGSYARIWVDGVLEGTVSVGSAAWLGTQEGQYIFSGRQANSEFLSGYADFMYGKGTLDVNKVRSLMYSTFRF